VYDPPPTPSNAWTVPTNVAQYWQNFYNNLPQASFSPTANPAQFVQQYAAQYATPQGTPVNPSVHTNDNQSSVKPNNWNIPKPNPSADISQQAASWIQAANKAGIDPKHVVDVYMNPHDPHAASDPNRALANAIADKIWAEAATAAFGRPPNEQEWIEHYYAKNYGSRDPLEGHPQAIQAIQDAANNLTNQGQSAGQAQAYDDLHNAGLI
jgi:hypothetical protein